MELREYWGIIWRRIWIIAGLVLVVLLATIIMGRRPQTSYQATLRFIVGVPPEPPNGPNYTYDRYYTWLASEYLADDFSEVVKSAAFAGNVTARLNGTIQVPAGAIQGSTVAEKQHRILTVRISWPDAAQLEKIAAATAQALEQDGSQYFSQLGEERARIHLIDPPAISPVAPSLRERFDLPIRLGLALLAGLFLAFLVDYLDDTIRDTRELEALGFTVLAAIPSNSKWFWQSSRRLP